MISAIHTSFSFNLWLDLKSIFQYEFMIHAFIAGTVIALVAGIIGYFVVIRRLSFAAHALSHVGFSGAAGAVLVGFNPLLGLLLFTSGGGISMAFLGKKAANRDVQIGTILAFMLGLGVLFISLYKGYATEAYSILFGEILGISTQNVIITLIAAFIILLTTVSIYRRLVYTSFQEEIAEARGISTLATNIVFLLLLAAATSISVQVVGVLLIFALLVTPAAIAQRLARSNFEGVIISGAVAIIVTWIGLFLSFYINLPVSFFITSTVFVCYVVVRLVQFKGSRSKAKLVN